MNKNLDIIKNSLNLNVPFVLATVVFTCGSVPQKPGAKMSIFADGSTLGTVGGGCVEGGVIKKSLELLTDDKTANDKITIDVSLDGKPNEPDADVCGGMLKILLEKI